MTVGHQAILHGCTVADDCLIGMGARILNGAVIEAECIVGAGALVTEGKRFERGSLIVGAPARVVRQVTEEEQALLRESATHYAEKAARYAAELTTLERLAVTLLFLGRRSAGGFRYNSRRRRRT